MLIPVARFVRLEQLRLWVFKSRLSVSTSIWERLIENRNKIYEVQPLSLARAVLDLDDVTKIACFMKIRA